MIIYAEKNMKIMHFFSISLFLDLSGKMFTFPQETNTAHVRLTASGQDYSALTVCHR